MWKIVFQNKIKDLEYTIFEIVCCGKWESFKEIILGINKVK